MLGKPFKSRNRLNRSPIRLGLVLCFLIVKALAQAVGVSTGLPVVRNFPPEEYGADLENYTIAQDHYGLIYVGNGLGVLEYDGVSWQLLPGDKFSTVRSLAVDKQGNIWVGASRDFGYIQSDSLGDKYVVSLRDKLGKEILDFNVVWNVHILGDRVFFATYKYLFRWDGVAMRTWKANSQFHLSFQVGDRLFVRQWDVGLMELIDDSLVVIPGGEAFAEERIFTMLPYGDEDILIGTKTQGLLLTGENGLHPFATNFDNLLVEELVYRGLYDEKNNLYLFASLGGGIIVSDAGGNLLDVFNKNTGLPNQTVYGMTLDRNGALWAALDVGLTRIDYQAEVREFDSRLNLPIPVYGMEEFSGSNYVGTGKGLYQMHTQDYKQGTEQSVNFSPVASDIGGVRLLHVHQDVLFCGSNRGLYIIRNGKFGTLIAERSILSIATSKSFPSRLYVGTRDGLLTVLKRNNQWDVESQIDDVYDEIRFIQENQAGDLWLGTLNRGVIRVGGIGKMTQLNQRQLEIERFSVNDGLPGNSKVVPLIFEQNIYFSTPKGIHRYNTRHHIFEPDSSLFEAMGNAYLIPGPIETDGKHWFYLPESKKLGYLQNVNDRLQWNTKAFNRVGSLNSLNGINIDKSGSLWLSHDQGLWHFRSIRDAVKDTHFSTLVRDIQLADGSRLLGNINGLDNRLNQILTADQNSLIFTLRSLTYVNEAYNQYQSYLEGYDDHWTDWNSATTRDYFKLPAGHYQFRVRSKNILNQISDETRIRFTILPPWYQTVWAYIIYGLLLLALIYLIVRMRLRILERENIQLEQKIAERTTELKDAQTKLYQSEKMAALGELVAGVAHEINTPLGVGVTAASHLQNSTHSMRALFGEENISIEELDNYLKSSDELSEVLMTNLGRAAELIQSFKKVAVDQSSDETREFALGAYLDEIVKSLKPQFRHTGHTVRVEYEEDITITSYPGAFSQIITNFIMNSLQHGFKDMKNGRMTIRMFQIGEVVIEYADNGKGILPEHEHKIFHPFFTTARGTGGSGLGLNIVYNLVTQKLGGNIQYKPHPENGVLFILRIPITT
jgi:signal transduction histidine kinase/ligand-binding sensor domain-containing protein